MKQILLALLLVLCCLNASSSVLVNDSNAVTLVRYQQDVTDEEASISLRNNTESTIYNVRFLLCYYGMDNVAIDYKEFSESVEIAPRMTRQIDIPAFEKRRGYSYYKSRGLSEDRKFKISFKLLGCNEGRITKKSVEGRMLTTGNVFDVVEQMPSFPGGPSALMKYLNDNIKYPAEAQENGVQGRVTISFIVNTDGSLSNAHVTRSLDPSLDREAVRVVKSMPRWVPGKHNGKFVRVSYNVPVSFRLQ